MQNGFNLALRGMIWFDKDEKFKLNTPIWKAMENIANMGFIPKGNTAWRCFSCQFILVDHSTLVDKKNKKNLV